MRGKLLAATIICKIAQAIGEAALGQAVVVEVERSRWVPGALIAQT